VESNGLSPVDAGAVADFDKVITIPRAVLQTISERDKEIE
jgi:hypothetical protein